MNELMRVIIYFSTSITVTSSILVVAQDAELTERLLKSHPTSVIPGILVHLHFPLMLLILGRRRSV